MSSPSRSRPLIPDPPSTTAPPNRSPGFTLLGLDLLCPGGLFGVGRARPGGPTLLPRLPKSGVTTQFTVRGHCGGRDLVSNYAVRVCLCTFCPLVWPTHAPTPALPPPRTPIPCIPVPHTPRGWLQAWPRPGSLWKPADIGAHSGTLCLPLSASVSSPPHLQGHSASPTDSVSPGPILAGAGVCSGAGLPPGALGSELGP